MYYIKYRVERNNVSWQFHDTDTVKSEDVPTTRDMITSDLWYYLININDCGFSFEKTDQTTYTVILKISLYNEKGKLITEKKRIGFALKTLKEIADEQKLLSKSEDINDRKKVASNPYTPGEVLAELAKDTNPDVRSSVANNPSATPEVLSELAKDTDYNVRGAVAMNLHTPVKNLTELATDANDWVRKLVAFNTNTNQETLYRLLPDKSPDVSHCAKDMLNFRKMNLK